MRPVRLTILSAVLASALTGASCAGDPAEPAGAAPVPAAATGAVASPNPCDLLTAASIERVIGEPVEAPQRQGFECVYHRKPDGRGGLATRAVRVRLEVGEGSPYDLYNRYLTTIRTALTTPYEPESVLGVGSIAGWDGDALLVGASVDRTRSAFLMLQLDGVAPDRERQLAESLGAEALSQLGRQTP